MVAEELELTGRLLLFRVGPGRFALPLEDVLGVRDSDRIESGRGLEKEFRGRPVKVIDAHALWWGAAGGPVARQSPALIIAVGKEPAALLVDRVEGIVEGLEMRSLPALIAPFVKGVFRGVALHADGGRLVVVPAALAGAAAAGGQGGPGEA